MSNVRRRREVLGVSHMFDFRMFCLLGNTTQLYHTTIETRREITVSLHVYIRTTGRQVVVQNA